MGLTLQQVCDGDAGCCINFLLLPFVLTWNMLNIYVFSCFNVVWLRMQRFLCKPFACCYSWVYKDSEFEGQKALGQNKNLDWVRAGELLSEADAKKGIKPKLYEGGIQPSDLCQGAVGNCWLVAALACAAEHPSSIRNAFLTPEANSRGKYRVRLYNPDLKKWTHVTVDDRIPCKAGTQRPEYMKCDGKELWAVLLEKAFAKFCGTYNALDGGWAVWGWRVLTGDNCFRLKYDETAKEWRRIDFEAKMSDGQGGTGGAFRGTSEKYTKDEMWNILLNYVDDKSLIGASGGKDMGQGLGGAGSGPNSGGLNGEQLNEAHGLVGGHAYSILDARELGLIPGLSLGGGVLGQTRLVRLRNPWGEYEWKGAWSDGAKEWDQNPLVKMRLRPKEGNDGSFWMPWDQFEAAGFHNIDICDRTTKDDLRLNVEEDMGMCGVLCGCLKGIFNFFCLCQGCVVLYFGNRTSTRTKSTKRGCAKCMEKDVQEPVQIKIDRA